MVNVNFYLSPQSPQVQQLAQTYQRVTGESLSAAISKNHSGDLEKLFLALARGQRSDAPLRPPADLELAKRLYKAGEGKFGTDEKTFIDVFSSHGPLVLQQVSQQYLNQHGRTLIAAVEKEFSKGMKRALIACVDPEVAYFGMLQGTMAGIGTDDMGLIWLIASRPRWEMRRICDTYAKMHGNTLEKDIRGDTSGSYQKALLAYIEPLP